MSDCIPIKGRKRIPYLFIATLLSLFPWLILGLQETIRNSRDQLMIFLLLQNLGSAMADVVIDAMIAEAARLEKYIHLVGFLSLFSYFSILFLFSSKTYILFDTQNSRKEYIMTQVKRTIFLPSTLTLFSSSRFFIIKSLGT